MKSIIILVLLIFGLTNGFAQNPIFYQDHPTNTAIKWYLQINKDPIIIQNGVLTSESVVPGWYYGSQFLYCPGTFDTVDEAYSYLTTNPLFLDPEDNSYENRDRLDQQLYYVNRGKIILERAKSYSRNEEATKDYVPLVLARCRERVIFAEMYLKYNDYEILLLYSSHMYLVDMDVNSPDDIQQTLWFMENGASVGGIDSFSDSYNMAISFLLKEDGIWKDTNFNKMDDFIQSTIPSFDFVSNNGFPTVHVESTLDSSGTRVYTEL